MNIEENFVILIVFYNNSFHFQKKPLSELFCLKISLHFCSYINTLVLRCPEYSPK